MAQKTDTAMQTGGNGGNITVYYVHEDIMGNTRYHTQMNGQSFAELEYDVWGAPTSPGMLLNNDNGVFIFAKFTGHTYDTVLDIYFAQARFYDAKNRQWMSSDPMKDGLNWYQYVGANPATWYDPWGLTQIGVDGKTRADISENLEPPIPDYYMGLYSQRTNKGEYTLFFNPNKYDELVREILRTNYFVRGGEILVFGQRKINDSFGPSDILVDVSSHIPIIGGMISMAANIVDAAELLNLIFAEEWRLIAAIYHQFYDVWPSDSHELVEAKYNLVLQTVLEALLNGNLVWMKASEYFSRFACLYEEYYKKYIVEEYIGDILAGYSAPEFVGRKNEKAVFLPNEYYLFLPLPYKSGSFPDWLKDLHDQLKIIPVTPKSIPNMGFK